MKPIFSAPTRPPATLIYGIHKIGKSSFAKDAPKPIYIDTEGGLEHLGVECFPRCKTYEEVLEAFEYLVKTEHDYKTIVIDSADWLEKLIWEDVCKLNNWAQIGDGPYGAGYKLALNHWRTVIKYLAYLNEQKKMWVLIIGHAKIARFEDPERESYDKYMLDMNEKSAKMLMEYVDIIGFANYHIATVSKKEGFGESVKVKSSGKRMLFLNNKASFEAGNRYSLPDSIPLDFKELEKGVKQYFASIKPGNLSEAINIKE